MDKIDSTNSEYPMTLRSVSKRNMKKSRGMIRLLEITLTTMDPIENRRTRLRS